QEVSVRREPCLARLVVQPDGPQRLRQRRTAWRNANGAVGRGAGKLLGEFPLRQMLRWIVVGVVAIEGRRATQELILHSPSFPTRRHEAILVEPLKEDQAGDLGSVTAIGGPDLA